MVSKLCFVIALCVFFFCKFEFFTNDLFCRIQLHRNKAMTIRISFIVLLNGLAQNIVENTNIIYSS